MSRRHITFGCEGETLVGTLDDAEGETGLLIVTGGNETRAGAYSGQAQMAEYFSALGFPVFRFDRRGVGDSTGKNGGYQSSLPDITAAIAAFRAEAPHVKRIVAHGNCDAAAVLMHVTNVDARLLSNPWLYEEQGEAEDSTPSAGAVRSRYLQKLTNPRELLRLFTGKVHFRKLLGGLKKAASSGPKNANPKAANLAQLIKENQPPVTILLAGRDRTAEYFLENWDKNDPRLHHCPSADHSFSGNDEREWFFSELRSILDEQTG